MRYILFCILVIFSFMGKAQEIDRQVLGSSGDFFSTSNVQLSFTLGEIMTETYHPSSSSLVGVLNQGFQQPSDNDLVSIQDDIHNSGMHLTVFPNPTSGPVTVSLSGKLPQEIILQLIDVTGKQLLQRTQRIPTGDTAEVQMDLGSFSTGSYFIRVTDRDGKGMGRFTVLKR